jgi:hypothetical protein
VNGLGLDLGLRNLGNFSAGESVSGINFKYIKWR